MAKSKISASYFKGQKMNVKEKRKTGENSIYIPVTITIFEQAKDYYSAPKKALANYVFEIDNQSGEHHFHIWKASGAKCRLSDTRSEAISVFEDGGCKHNFSEELRDNRKISVLERGSIADLLSESDKRFALYALIEAKKRGKRIANASLNLDELSIDLTDKELISLKKNFDKLMKEKDVKEFIF